MKGKFARMVHILNQLDQKQPCTANSLAQELEVDNRSIFRYLASLQEAGFPIYHDREKGSYAFVEGFQLRKADLSLEETLALAVAKKSLSHFGGAFDEALQGLERKVLDISTRLKDPIPASVFVLPDWGTKAYADISTLIKELAMACSRHRRVEITYVSLSSQKTSKREVEPYYLFFSFDGFWNLRAYCRLREEWRTFALDRIERCRVLDQSFIPRLFGDEVGKEVSSGFGTYMDGDVQEVVVRFSPQIRPFVERRTWHPSQKNTDLADGWLEVKFETTGLEALKYWLYRWIPHVKVVRPKELKQEILQDFEAQLANLSSQNPCQ